MIEREAAGIGVFLDRDGVINVYNSNYIRSLDDFISKRNRFSSVSAQHKHDKGERASWWDLRLRPVWRFFYGYVVRRGFLDGRQGYVAAKIEAHTTFLKYAKMWNLARAKSD